MKLERAILCMVVLTGTLFAAEGPVPSGVRRLDHVFVIMMENHGYSQIVGNPNAPFANELMKKGARSNSSSIVSAWPSHFRPKMRPLW